MINPHQFLDHRDRRSTDPRDLEGAATRRHQDLGLVAGAAATQRAAERRARRHDLDAAGEELAGAAGRDEVVVQLTLDDLLRTEVPPDEALADPVPASG